MNNHTEWGQRSRLPASQAVAALKDSLVCEETSPYLSARRTIANVEVVAFAAIHDEVHSARESHVLQAQESGIRKGDRTRRPCSISSHVDVIAENGGNRFVTAWPTPLTEADNSAIRNTIV